MIHTFRKALLPFIVAVATLSWCATTTYAQGRASIRQELSGEARKDWDAAKELFDAKDYRGALIQFERAYDKSKNPRILYNIGVCWKTLKRYAQAISAWEKELTFRDKLIAKDIKRLEQAIEVVRPFVSTLTVKANEPGAQLFINGDSVGETPFLGPVPIDVGRQEVELKKEGFQPLKKTVDVARDTPVALTFKLEPEAKKTLVSVSIEGAPKATIFVDGVEMGPAPFKGEVPARRHTFEARADGYEVARQTSDVVYGEPFNLTLTMVEARNEGKVKIVTGYKDAVIEIDGKVVGSGTWEGVLKAGGHQLEVKKDGYETYATDLALSADQERTLNVTLEKEQGYAWVYWTVSSVLVVAGGATASYFVFRPAETSTVTGTLNPGVTPAVRF